MIKLSFKDLVPEEPKKQNRSKALWTSIVLPAQEEKKVEYKASNPRNGIKSLLDLNEDIKPVKNTVIDPSIVLPEPVAETDSVIKKQELVEEISITEPIIKPIATLLIEQLNILLKKLS